MQYRTIEAIVSPPNPHYVGDGFRVHNFIPTGHRLGMSRTNPFLLLDYNAPFYFSPSNIPRGVGVHPHRGFETVTIAYKGKIEHQDSSGGGGIIAEGDVQWMTAASGILHKEFHELEFSKQGGYFQMVQLWVNLPAQYKMSAPKYQAVSNASIPTYTLPDGGGILEIIAGKHKDVLGTIHTFTPIHVINAKLAIGAKEEFQFPVSYTTALVVIEGSIKINNNDAVDVNHFVLFNNDAEIFTIEALQTDTIVLVISGEPIPEPIASHGPFVMNSQQELIQAFDDFQNGKFGYLE